MTPAILPFLFEGTALVRAVRRDGLPWFVAKDVAGVLGYQDTAKAVTAHCKRAVAIGEGVGETPTPSGGGKIGRRNATPHLDPQTKLIPQADVLRLILRSRLPAAERFEAWVMEDVLPSIMATGRYGSAPTVDPAAIRAVSECRKVFGERAAGQLWFALALPAVPAMQSGPTQGDLLGEGGR